MIDSLGGPTSDLLALALDAASQRHRVIANNIANANSVDFSPSRLDFERVLERLGASAEGGRASLESSIEEARSGLEAGDFVERLPGREVSLDTQMMDLSENFLRYRAVLETMDRRGAIMKLAIGRGNG